MRRFPVLIFSRPYESAAAQKNWALDLARHRWVLVLDADEVVGPGLLREIEEFDGTSGIDGFWIRRESHYLEGPIRHCGWQRDKVLRFSTGPRGIRRRRGARGGERPREGGDASKRAHASPVPQNRAAPPQDRTVQHARRARIREARRAVRDDPDAARYRQFRMARMYIAQRGFLDGKRGFLLCLLSSYGVFIKYAKAWEYARCRRER